MNNSLAAKLVMALSLIVLLIGCSNEKAKTEGDTEQATASLSASIGTGGGLQWNMPTGWETGPERSMRLVTYIIKAAEGDTDSAECAVFYFGASSGGGTEANIQRWAGQFEQPDGGDSMEKAKIEETEKGGIKTTIIDLTGTYLGSDAMVQSTGDKSGYRLLGAIIEGPEGSVFFKFTGKENTIAASDKAFRNMMSSIKLATVGS